MQDKFERLLKACECLARSERAALKGRDFTALEHLRDTKRAILIDLQGCAGNAAQKPALRARLEKLVEMNAGNRQLLAEMKADTMEKLKEVRAAVQKFQSLKPALSLFAPERKSGFEAHG